ncbi:MAG: hypothetical protein AB7P40_05370 [Chloroflexota bacterium]
MIESLASRSVSLITRLNAVTQAYAHGEMARAEHLFLEALDAGLPWDDVCTAAARGMAHHRERRSD